MDGPAGTPDPNSSLDFSLNKYDMIKRRRRTAKSLTLQKKEVANDNSENDEIVIDSDSSVRRSDTSAVLDKFDMIKSRRRSCKAPTLHGKGVVKDTSDDCGLVIDSDESTTKRQISKVNKKKKIRKSKASVIKDSDSESDESETNANCRPATKNKCRGRPRKKCQMKSRVKNETKSVKSCRTNGTVKRDDPEVITLEDTIEEIKPKQTKSKNSKRKTRKNDKVKNNIQKEKKDLVEHLKSVNFASGKKTVSEEKGMELKTSSAAKRNGKASLSSSDDDAVVLGYKLNGRNVLSSDLDDNVEVNEESTNTPNEFRLASKIQEERENRVDEAANAKKKPTPVVIVKDCLKTKLMTQIRGDFQLGSESESEEEKDGRVIMEEEKARILAQLKGDLQLPSESDSDGEVFSDDSDKNEVSKPKNKMKDSGDCNDLLVTGQSKKDNKLKSKPGTPATRKPVKTGKKKNIQTSGHVIKVKIGGAKTPNNVDGKEFKGKLANYTKKVLHETKEASLENCTESPDESVKNENGSGLKSTSESFVKAKYLVMQKRGFNPKPLIEKGSFEEQFRKKLMRADILKLAQSMDDGCVNTIQITDNMFDDSIEPENVVVSVKAEDLLGLPTVKQVKVDVNSTFSSDSDADDVEETLEEKMMRFLNNLKSSKFPEQTVPAAAPKRNDADDNLLERKMTKLVDLINSVGSVKCIERCWDKVITKTVQKSMPCVQLEETTKKFVEIQRQLNRERWLRNVCSNVEEDVPVAVKKEPPKPEVTFQPLKSTTFKIPKKTQPKKAWTKTAEMWRQALKVDDNGCYKVNEIGRRVLCKTHPRLRLDYTEVDFKDDAVKKPEIKGEVQVKRCDDKRFGVNMKTRSSPDKPLFTSSPKRLVPSDGPLLVPEDGPLLTSSPRHLASTPATKDLLLDISGSSDTLAGNLSYFGESFSSDHRGFDKTNQSFDGASQNEEVAADVLDHSKETRVRSPFAFEDLRNATVLGERRNGGKDWKGNTLDNPVVKENGKSICEEEQSTKSMFSSLFKKTLNKRKT